MSHTELKSPVAGWQAPWTPNKLHDNGGAHDYWNNPALNAEEIYNLDMEQPE